MWEQIEQFCEAFSTEDLNYLIREPYVILGAVALGLLVLWLLYRIRPRHKIKAFKGDTGPVEISKGALLELVRSACEQLPEVRKPSIRIRPRRKLNLSVRIKVDGSARLRDTASFLQNHIKDALENNLGVENLGKIQVMVTGIRAVVPKKVDLNQRGDKPAETPADKSFSTAPSQASSAQPTPAQSVSPQPAPATLRPAPEKTPTEAVKSPESPAAREKPGTAKPSTRRPDLNPTERKDPSEPAKPEKKDLKK